MPDPDRFRVIIVGGGVAGLTLANALEQAGVDYVLLERRGEIAPQVGASIGVFPNAARILDQLGVWQKVDEASEGLKVMYTRDAKGRLICKPERSPLLSYARFGYFVAWGERQNLLRILFENLRDPSKVLVAKDLVDIQHDAEGVTAVCADGSSFRGDILVGADGVFSRTRSKMWEMAEPANPDLVKKREIYNCLFGIAKGVACEQLQPGDLQGGHNPGRCIFVIGAEGGKVYWFAQERLPQTYRLGNIPRYTDDDARAFVARNGDLVMIPRPHGLTLADLWEKTVSFRLVAVEEAKFKLWHWGRIVCAGDSIHKSTPNLGVGGNAAVESAAALANGIKRLADTWAATGRRPSQEEVEHMLAEYQKQREVRAAAGVDSSGLLTRAQNLQGWTSRLFVKFALPHFSEFIADLTGDALVGATKLDFLPLPMVSLTGTRPFNPTQGEGLQESKLKRALFALPLLSLCFVAMFVMNATPALDWAYPLRDSGKFDLGSGSVPILRSFYGIRGFDDFVALINTFFFPAVYGTDPVSRRQAISFLADLAVLLTIWLLESTRRANLFTPMQLPNLFALLGQGLGIGVVAPVYCFLHYVLTPVEKFSALDQRLTNLRWSRAVLPAVAAAFAAPFCATVFWPAGDQPISGGSGGGGGGLLARQRWLFVWQLYPVWLALALWAGSRLSRDTMRDDKVYRPLRDLPVLRASVGAASVCAAGVWWWVCLGGGEAYGYGVRKVFVPAAVPRHLGSLTEFTREFLKWDEVFGFGSHLVWLAYLFGDLAEAGMLREGWLTAVGLGLVSLLAVGPGATLGLGWLWREHILATRRHKAALTPESVVRLHGIPPVETRRDRGEVHGSGGGQGAHLE
ncbi:76920dad-2e05-476e-8657-376aa0d4bde4 [Thermothielavioides terrestris]|uniref:76920dad-2e05-476e-8657-376aa0d4bde4 n=1 Tax=Thermothielavioides terrestris TaxID=2587410 RepID=A0A446BS81_9PEZI|nr:76920dad-2e05-476e-8657-376aa0d4bde4 [Thermothielavioides terrestris]